MRDLGQHAATVAERRIRAHRAAVVEVDQDLQTLFEDVVRLAVLHVGDEADAAGIMLLGGIVEPLRRRRQRVPARIGLREPAAQLIERRSSCGVHLSAPRAVAHLVRPLLQIFRRISGQRRLLTRSQESVTRRIFFDPSLSFDPTTLEPRSSVGAKLQPRRARKNGQHNCPIFRHMTEMDCRHKQS